MGCHPIRPNLKGATVKILLLGCNGQVGWELQRSLAVLGEVVALGSSPAQGDGSLCGDLGNLEALAHTVRTLAPQVIVNAAAYTAVDRAEREPERAHAINAVAPGVLAAEAQRLGAWLVHYSTDYVFDGSGSVAWKEGDACAPLSVYGRTKRAGELAVAQCPRHLVFRTSWVYAARGGNFARTMLKLAQERDALKVIDDQIGAPTGADLLADLTAHAMRSVALQPQHGGTYHAVASGHTSWHGYATHVIENARSRGVPIRVAREAIAAVPTSAFPTPARRPANSRLDTEKLRNTFGLYLPDWRSGVDRMLAEVLG
jgi:dTDP-4-dehydrorhamnose reductase